MHENSHLLTVYDRLCSLTFIYAVIVRPIRRAGAQGERYGVIVRLGERVRF